MARLKSGVGKTGVGKRGKMDLRRRAWEDGRGKMGMGKKVGKMAVGKKGMEGDGPGKVAMGKGGRGAVMRKMGVEHMPHGSSGEDTSGHSCLAPRDATQGASRLSALMDLRPPQLICWKHKPFCGAEGTRWLTALSSRSIYTTEGAGEPDTELPF